jgi:hypothetical protein
MSGSVTPLKSPSASLLENLNIEPDLLEDVEEQSFVFSISKPTNKTQVSPLSSPASPSIASPSPHPSPLSPSNDTASELQVETYAQTMARKNTDSKVLIPEKKEQRPSVGLLVETISQSMGRKNTDTNQTVPEVDEEAKHKKAQRKAMKKHKRELKEQIQELEDEIARRKSSAVPKFSIATCQPYISCVFCA